MAQEFQKATGHKYFSLFGEQRESAQVTAWDWQSHTMPCACTPVESTSSTPLVVV